MLMKTYKLDIRKDHCPMTFVKAKLELEKLAKGDRLEILLTEGEPLENVPRTAVEQGFTVLEVSTMGGNEHLVVVGYENGAYQRMGSLVFAYRFSRLSDRKPAEFVDSLARYCHVASHAA